jgi:predicted metalloprotease with PDZ domain
VPPKAAGSSDLSQIPPGQHPLIRHPLKSSKPQASAPAVYQAPQTPFQPEKNVVFTTLQQPAANAITDLGIVAANTKSGVMISHVGIASRASKAGLLKGDLIRAVDNKVVTTLAQVMAIVSKKAPDAPIDLHIQRKDQMGVVHL